MLDTEVTPELAAEGLARDVIRVVQQARRDAGLDVADRIALVVEAAAEVPRRSRTRTGTFVAARDAGHRGHLRQSRAPTFAGEAGDGTPIHVTVTPTP